MRISVLRAVVLAIALVCSAFGGRAAAQCGGAQLCAPGANPCVVPSGTCNLTSGATYDLGGRNLTFAAGARVAIPATTPVGIVITNVGDVVMEPNAWITAAEFDDSFPGFPYRRGQRVSITANGKIEMRTSAAGVAKIDVRGSHEGGEIELRAGTDATLGLLDTSASNGGGYGGQVFVVAQTGAITVLTAAASGIDVSGGNTVNDDVEGTGGALSLLAATDITVGSPIIATGGDCSLCSVALVAQSGSVSLATTGTVAINATGAYGSGGELGIEAGGGVTLAGAVAAAGKGSTGEQEGGSGGLVGIEAGGNVTVSAPIDLVAHTNNAPDGAGGELSIEALGQVRIGGAVTLGAPGAFSQGGIATITAGSLLEISALIDVGSAAFAGSIDLHADGTLDVTPTGKLLTMGGATNTGGAGTLDAAACIVRLRGTSPTVRSEVRNGGFVEDLEMPFGINVLRVGQSCEINGRLLAPTGENRVFRRAGVSACQPGANFDIDPPIIYAPDDIPELPCCGDACSATTTTLPPATTTTTITEPPPSTTTTTLPDSTTTTTLASQTTTTTTSPQTTSTTEPQTTTTTTTTSEPSTTTTTTSEPGSTTTSTLSPATTSTTATVPTTTTTTLAPDPCDAPATDYDAVQCGLGAIDAVLAGNSAGDLGGSRFVTKLGKLLDRAEAALTQSTTARNPKPKLRRVRSQLRAFERAVRKAAKKQKLRSDLGAALLGLTTNTGGALDVLRSASS